MKSQNKFLSNVSMSLRVIFFIGIAVFGWLAYTGLETYKNDISSLYIMGAFFILVAVAFIVAAKMLNKAARIKNELLRITSEIQSLSDSEKSNYIVTLQERNHIFSEKELESEFNKFLSDLNNVSKVSKETKIDIKNYINYELIDESISLHYLSQVSGIMTSLGILGTFLGLSIGLNAFDLSGNAQDLENKIVPLMDGIKVAFHTSICGLIYSILYNLYFRHCLNDVRDALDQFIETFENNIITVTENGSNIAFAKYQERLCQSLDMQLESQNAFYKQQYEHSKLLVESMQRQDVILENLGDGITKQIAVMMRDIIVPSVENMTETVKRFAEATQKSQLEGLDQIVTSFIDKMNSTLGDSFSELGTVINETNAWQKKSLTQMEETLNKVNGMSIEMASINQSFAGIINSIEGYEEHVSKLQERVVESMDAVNKQIEINNSAIATQSESVNSLLTNAKEVREDITLFISNVKKAIETIDNYNSDLSKQLQTKLTSFEDIVQKSHIKMNECLEQTQSKFIEGLALITSSANENIVKYGHSANAQLENLAEINDNIMKQMETQTQGVASNIEEISKKFEQKLEDMHKTFADNVALISASANEKLEKSAEQAQTHYDAMVSQNKHIVEVMEKQVEVFASKTQATCENAYEKISELHKDFVDGMDDVIEVAANKIGECVDDVSKKLTSVLSVNRDITDSINKAAETLNESAKRFSNSADAKLTKTFATFDAELTTITKHFGAAILELQKTLDKVPVVVEDVYGDVDQKFESIRKTLDEYLEYADKLHRNLEFKWKQLQDEMGKNK